MILGRFESLADAEAFAGAVKDDTYTFSNPAALEKFSGADLVGIHNSMCEKEDHVKKFETKAKATTRVWALLQKATSTVAAVSSRKDAGTPRNNYSGKTIHLVAGKECPRREGSHGADHWELYKDGMRYEDFIKARKASGIPGGTHSHFLWDINAGFIALK